MKAGKRKRFRDATGARRVDGGCLFFAVLARGATLEFVRDGTVVARLDDATLAKDCGLRTIEVDDPYYGTRKRYGADYASTTRP